MAGFTRIVDEYDREHIVSVDHIVQVMRRDTDCWLVELINEQSFHIKTAAANSLLAQLEPNVNYGHGRPTQAN